MNKLAIILAGIAMAAVAAPSFAAEQERGPGPGMERLKAADKNGDGLISRAEAAVLPRIAAQFDALDTNKDGQLSPEELRAHHQAMRAQHEAKRAERWKKVDTDGDGRISKAEAQANAPRMFEHFDQIDTNKDGFISQEEMKAAHAKRGSK